MLSQLQQTRKKGNSSILPIEQAKLSLTDLIENHITTENPSFSGVILIGLKNEILFHHSYGLGDRENSTPIALDSKFLIGSITKQITAALILKSFKEQSLDLQDPIHHFLPDLNEEWTKKVTVHHLLTHTSGLEGDGKGLKFKPGEKYEYSNFGFGILGKILEVHKSKNYNDLICEFLAELEMNSTEVTGEGEISEIRDRIPDLVKGYDKDENNVFSIFNDYRDAFNIPSKGLVSTALDLLKWNDSLHQGKILDTEDYSQMVQPHIKVSNSNNYGYALNISNDGELKEISHNGIAHGYLTSVVYYPDLKISLIILGNHLPFHTTWDRTGNEEMICHEQNAIRRIVRGFLSRHLYSISNSETELNMDELFKIKPMLTYLHDNISNREIVVRPLDDSLARVGDNALRY